MYRELIRKQFEKDRRKELAEIENEAMLTSPELVMHIMKYTSESSDDVEYKLFIGKFDVGATEIVLTEEQYKVIKEIAKCNKTIINLDTCHCPF